MGQGKHLWSAAVGAALAMLVQQPAMAEITYDVVIPDPDRVLENQLQGTGALDGSIQTPNLPLPLTTTGGSYATAGWSYATAGWSYATAGWSYATAGWSYATAGGSFEVFSHNGRFLDPENVLQAPAPEPQPNALILAGLVAAAIAAIRRQMM